MSHQIGIPKTAREAMRYFHAVCLDYVESIKKQFPNHDISITPSTLSYGAVQAHQNATLEINICVWDRKLQLAFEMFAEPQWDGAVQSYFHGMGSLTTVHPRSVYRLIVRENGHDPWLRWIHGQDPKELDVEFLLEQLKLLLVPLPRSVHQ